MLNTTGARNNWIAAGPPLPTDDITAGYDVLSLWWDSLNNALYMCVNADLIGLAQWVQLN